MEWDGLEYGHLGPLHVQREEVHGRVALGQQDGEERVTGDADKVILDLERKDRILLLSLKFAKYCIMGKKKSQSCDCYKINCGEKYRRE